jgi:hypothetical protein
MPLRERKNDSRPARPCAALACLARRQVADDRAAQGLSRIERPMRCGGGETLAESMLVRSRWRRSPPTSIKTRRRAQRLPASRRPSSRTATCESSRATGRNCRRGGRGCCGLRATWALAEVAQAAGGGVEWIAGQRRRRGGRPPAVLMPAGAACHDQARRAGRARPERSAAAFGSPRLVNSSAEPRNRPGLSTWILGRPTG